MIKMNFMTSFTHISILVAKGMDSTEEDMMMMMKKWKEFGTESSIGNVGI